MVSVFLSHSSQDKPFVRELANALEAGGEIKVWLDEREIGYGENIVLKIGQGLDADVVLLILSPDSVDSKWVKEEWADAYWDQTNSQRTKLAGVLYRDCQIPRLLRNKKYFDLRTNQPQGFREIRTWLLGLRAAPPPVVHLPQRSPLFIGREPEIETLRTKLKEPGSVAYVSGLAGRGKTTLALEYAHRHHRDFESVHWLPCQKRSLVQIAGELTWQLGLKLEGELDTIVRELNGHCARKRCLLVLDNVEDDAPARLLPGGRSSVLITTRFNTLRFLRSCQPLNLPLFTEEQCFELFAKEIGREEVEKHKAEARTLFQRLGHLPIGIAVTASLIREDVRYAIAGMAKSLPADVTALLREAVAALSLKAQSLLAAMAVCAPEGFRLGLAAEVADLDDSISLDALQEIYSRSLTEELDRDDRRYRLHTLVREAAGATDAQRRKHAESIQEEFKGWSNGWRQCEKDMADLQVALAWLLSQPDDEARSMADGLAYRGYQLTRRVGRLTEAHEICGRMVRAADHRNDRKALRAWLGNQALILQDWGRLEEAMRLFEKVEAISMELDDKDSLRRTYANRALILNVWGLLDDAMELHKKEESICLELDAQEGLQLSYRNQALILKAWGHLEDAMELSKKQEAICQSLDDAQDGLQLSYGNQASIHEAAGRLEDAMELYKKQEAICKDFGLRDGLQMSYGGEASILQARGSLDDAMKLYKKQEAICLELGNRDSLQRTYGNQALILKDRGGLVGATGLLKEMEAICLDLHHKEGFAHCYWYQGLVARKLGDSKTEREKLERALVLFTELKMPREIKAVQDQLDKTNRNSQRD